MNPHEALQNLKAYKALQNINQIIVIEPYKALQKPVLVKHKNTFIFFAARPCKPTLC